MLPPLVLGLESTGIGERPDEELRQGFPGARDAAAGSENKKQMPLLAPRGGRAGSLHEGRVGVMPGSGRRGGLGSLPTPVVRLVYGPCAVPAFAPGTSTMPLCLWPFVFSCSEELSQLCVCMQLMSLCIPLL